VAGTLKKKKGGKGGTARFSPTFARARKVIERGGKKGPEEKKKEGR